MRPRNPIRAVMGLTIAHKRKTLGMSQEVLGDAIGLSCQQISKFERGCDRISAETLCDMAAQFGCPVAELFAGIEDHLPPARPIDADAIAFTKEYQKLTPSMRASMKSVIGALILETAGKLRV